MRSSAPAATSSAIPSHRVSPSPPPPRAPPPPPPAPTSPPRSRYTSPHHLLAALALHAQLLCPGLLFAPPPHAPNVLLNFYAAAGRLPSLRHLFNQMPFRDILSHNTMMTPYAAVEAGPGGGIDAAGHLFDGMLLRNVVSWNVMINGYVKAKFRVRERHPENQDVYVILDDLVSKVKLARGVDM